MSKSFANPDAFRQALEARLRTAAENQGIAINDLRLKLIMERLLARLFAKPNAPWLLKGGYAMELRYRPHARTTRDVDLTIARPDAATLAMRIAAARDQIQEAAEIDLGDHLGYRIGSPRGELPGAPLGGTRFPVECLLAGRRYGVFHLDVGFGDVVIGEPEMLTGEDFLGFAGVPAGRALAIPQAQQFAEKIHAYTYPWTDRTNTRTKDLVDLVLLIERGGLVADNVKAALDATFGARGAHSKPKVLPAPPASWAAEFPFMAAQAELSTADLDAAYGVLAEFWETRGLGV